MAGSSDPGSEPAGGSCSAREAESSAREAKSSARKAKRMTPGEDLLKEFLEQPVWVVVGASRDPSRYGHRVLVALRKAGYRAYAVNPNADEIAGERAYPSLAALPETPDVVDTVVPPAVTARTVEEAAALGVTRVWMQPGSESDEAIRLAEERGMRVVHHACAMVGAIQGPARARQYGDEGKQ